MPFFAENANLFGMESSFAPLRMTGEGYALHYHVILRPQAEESFPPLPFAQDDNAEHTPHPHILLRIAGFSCYNGAENRKG